MIGLVVCSILIAGFLAIQGTSIGIARNERDAERARAASQSGTAQCLWLIKNKPDWRSTMTPGTWLASQSVGNSTVTVSASDDTNNFTDDPTQSVTFTSTGSYSGRTYTLTTTVTPTGGGTVFGGGNFVGTTVLLGKDVFSFATIDSYDSSSGNYRPFFPRSNAAFRSNLANQTVLTLNGLSVYRGSLTVGPNSILNLATILSAWGIGPSSTSSATEVRAPGNVMLPNPATSLASRGALTRSSSTLPITAGGSYSSITLSSSAVVNVTSSGLIRVTGGMSISSPATFNINSGVTLSLIVDGGISCSGNIKVTGSGQLIIYANSNIALTGSSARINPLQKQPRNVQILGTSNCTSIRLSNGAEATAAIFAPQAEVRMDGSGVPEIYGAVVADNLRMDSNAALHFDEDLRSLQIHTIYGGSAPTGTADYTITTTNGGTLSGSAPTF